MSLKNGRTYFSGGIYFVYLKDVNYFIKDFINSQGEERLSGDDWLESPVNFYTEVKKYKKISKDLGLDYMAFHNSIRLHPIPLEHLNNYGSHIDTYFRRVRYSEPTYYVYDRDVRMYLGFVVDRIFDCLEGWYCTKHPNLDRARIDFTIEYKGKDREIIFSRVGTRSSLSINLMTGQMFIASDDFGRLGKQAVTHIIKLLSDLALRYFNLKLESVKGLKIDSHRNVFLK